MATSVVAISSVRRENRRGIPNAANEKHSTALFDCPRRSELRALGWQRTAPVD